VIQYMLDSQFRCSHIESREVQEKKTAKTQWEKSARNTGKKRGEISPFHFRFRFTTSGDATSGVDPPHDPSPMCEKRNCESNMYWITIVLLPAIAMLSHFLNPWLITALTGTPVSINNEVFQTEEIYIIVCCLIKDLSLLFYYFKYYTIHMGFNTLF
jgi:hypothetical protein